MAITYPIEDVEGRCCQRNHGISGHGNALAAAIAADRCSWGLTTWPMSQMPAPGVVPPHGWDVRCGATANGLLYFATNAGFVMEGETGGNDNGAQYAGKYVPKFDGRVSRDEDRQPCGRDVFVERNADVQDDGPVGLFRPVDFRSQRHRRRMKVRFGERAFWGTFVWGGASSTQVYTVWKGIRAAGHAVSHAFLCDVEPATSSHAGNIATRSGMKQPPL